MKNIARNIAKIAAVIAGLMAASTALAGDDGMYLLAGVGKPIAGDGGQSTIDNLVATAGGTGFSSSMSTPTTYKVQVGFQLDENLALEGGYIGSQTVNYSATGGNLNGAVSSTSRISGWNLTGIGALPLGQGFSLLGKLGFANMQELASAKATGFTDFTSGAKLDITYGVGVKLDLAKGFFVRLDVDRYDLGSANASSLSTVAMLGLGYKF
jgi:Outer membrane protein beta-barrel domain